MTRNLIASFITSRAPGIGSVVGAAIGPSVFGQLPNPAVTVWGSECPDFMKLRPGLTITRHFTKTG
jgi:hypothetical protein